jgi:hypothetical protein
MAETTQHRPLTGQRPSERVTIYAPDGSRHECSPVDAREILAGGSGYTAEKPRAKDEQPQRQQSLDGDAIGGQSESDEAPTKEVIQKVSAGRGRPKK